MLFILGKEIPYNRGQQFSFLFLQRFLMFLKYLDHLHIQRLELGQILTEKYTAYQGIKMIQTMKKYQTIRKERDRKCECTTDR